MRILIVDDEPLARIGLRTILETSGDRDQIFDEPDAGRALLTFAAINPELCIVDINLPDKSGLEFIQEAKALNPKARFVIVSCVSDFSALRQSIRLEVSDYFVKTALDNGELISLVRRIRDQASVESVDTVPRSSGEGDASRDELIKVLQGCSLDSEAMAGILGILGILPPFELLLLQPKCGGGPGDDGTLSRGEFSIIESTVREYGQALALATGGGKLWILIRPDADTDSMLVDLAERIQLSCERYFNHGMDVVRAEVPSVERFEAGRDLALELVSLGFYSESPICLVQGKALPVENVKDIFAPAKLALMAALRTAEYDHVEELLHDLEARLVAGQVRPIAKVRNRLCELSFLISNHAELYFSDSPGDFTAACTDFGELNAMPSLASVMRTMIESVKGMRLGSGEDRLGYYNWKVARAKDYIETHLGDETGLEHVASQVNISPSHFSRIFKDLTGETYIDYCMRRKVDRAKAYINEGRKVYIAAELVGYCNYSYFSRLFKKTTGLTPEEYRAQRQKENTPP